MLMSVLMHLESLSTLWPERDASLFMLRKTAQASRLQKRQQWTVASCIVFKVLYLRIYAYICIYIYLTFIFSVLGCAVCWCSPF